MDILPLLCIVSVALIGLTKGVGVLPDGPLAAAVGQKVMFTTTVTPPDKPFASVSWSFVFNNTIKYIITSTSSNTTNTEYQGRITLNRSTGSLELRALALSDSGEYRLSIIPDGGEQMAGSTLLEILVPVSSVTVTPSSTDLVEFNSSVSLSCSSSGSSLSFLWLNDSSVVTASERVQLTDGGSTLTIVNVTRYDQGPFCCSVSNAVSVNTSAPVNLFISYGPDNIHLTLSPSQEYYEKGSNIILSCKAASRPSAQFMWFLNADLLPDTGPELTLMNIQMSQSGNYRCQAFNIKTLRYQTSQPSAVTVLERVSGASITSSTNQLIEWNSANLTCDGAGSIFTREWMKNGSPLTLADNMTLHDKNRVLSFHYLKKKDSGEYLCNISNPINNDEAKYRIVVNYGPENVKITGPSTINVKQTLTLTCSAESTPSASYTWKRNGTEILYNSAVFTNNMTEPSDSGDYICEALNIITMRTSNAVHRLSVTEETLMCSAVCIAGIVIACVVICGGMVAGGYCIYKKKKRTKMTSNGNTSIRTGDEGQDNSAYSGSQELNYADISFFQKKDGGTVQLGLPKNTSEYAQVNHGPAAAASAPPSYDVHLQRMKRPAPQPGTNGPQVYSQVHKN